MNRFRINILVLPSVWLLLGMAAMVYDTTTSVAAASASGCHTFSAHLSGADEVPPNSSTATGFGGVWLSPDETTITVTLTYSGLSGDQSGAHIHGPAAPGVPAPVLFTLASSGGPTATLPALVFSVTPTQVMDLRNGLWYFNVHSAGFPGGEIRGQISCICGYTSQLTGAQQVPPVQTESFGSGTVTLSPNETQILATLNFQNLTSSSTAAHIHGPAFPGMNAGIIFDLSASGSTSETHTLLFSVNPTQVTQLRSGQWYFNVHSTTFTGGEIRGQIVPECRIFLPVILK